MRNEKTRFLIKTIFSAEIKVLILRSRNVISLLMYITLIIFLGNTYYFCYSATQVCRCGLIKATASVFIVSVPWKSTTFSRLLILSRSDCFPSATLRRTRVNLTNQRAQKLGALRMNSEYKITLDSEFKKTLCGVNETFNVVFRGNI